MTTAEPAQVLLTPAEAAVRADRSEATIRRWVRTRVLPGRRVGAALRIPLGDLDQLLRGTPVGGRPTDAAGAPPIAVEGD